MAGRWLIFLLLFSALLAGCGPSQQQTMIWFVDLDDEIRTFNPATGEQRVVLPREPHTLVQQPSLSPDATRIVYTKNAVGQGPAIWVANTDGSGVKRATRDYEWWAYSFWISDTALMVSGTDSEQGITFEGEVALYDTSTGQTKPLALPQKQLPCPVETDPKLPARTTVYSPGYALAHEVVADGKLVEVEDVPVDTAQFEKRLFTCMSATPDARKIAFSGGNDDMTEDLYVAADAGKTIQPLTHFTQDYGTSHFYDYAISPDGKWVAFVIDLEKPRLPDLPTDIQMGLVSTDGRTLKMLMQTSLRGGHIAWSPDSRQFAAGLLPRGADPRTVTEKLHIVDVATQEIKQVIFDGEQKVLAWR